MHLAKKGNPKIRCFKNVESHGETATFSPRSWEDAVNQNFFAIMEEWNVKNMVACRFLDI